MIPVGGRVLVALSGGPDSVALTLLLKDLEDRGSFRVAGIAHVNHGLRASAGDDEEFCRAFADRMGAPFFVERADVRAVARRRRRSLEDTGRFVRYDFFRRLLTEDVADVVATGHTRDDQAETFLLRLIRGAGSRGLSGIHPAAGQVVRPLFDVRRRELRDHLAGRDQGFCEDETNRDVAIARNRVRHELIPYIERAFSPGIVEVLAREADAAREDERHLQQEAIESAGLIVLRNSSTRDAVPLSPDRIAPGPESGWFEPVSSSLGADIVAVEIDAARLAALPRAVASRVARLALSILADGRFVAYEHVRTLLALASAERGSASLAGQQAIRRGTRIELVRERVQAFANSFRVPLSIPGEVILQSQGWAISAEVGAARERPAASREPARQTLTAAVRADRLAPPLAVRSRRPGDRFQPPGMGGRHRKLQDVLVDRKVARETRDLLPLVVDGEDRIVWIVGHAVGADFRVTEPSQGVIFLIARRLGGPG